MQDSIQMYRDSLYVKSIKTGGDYIKQPRKNINILNTK